MLMNRRGFEEYLHADRSGSEADGGGKIPPKLVGAVKRHT